jgi:hypothetical protein
MAAGMLVFTLAASRRLDSALSGRVLLFLGDANRFGHRIFRFSKAPRPGVAAGGLRISAK